MLSHIHNKTVLKTCAYYNCSHYLAKFWCHWLLLLGRDTLPPTVSRVRLYAVRQAAVPLRQLGWSVISALRYRQFGMFGCVFEAVIPQILMI